MLDSLLGMIGLQRTPGEDPSADVPPVTPDVLPLDVPQWRARLDGSAHYIKDKVTKGKENVRRYRMKHYQGSASLTQDAIQVPVDQWNVDQKRAQLFYRVPEVVMSGKTQEADANAFISQGAINQQIGPEHINTKQLMDMLIYDIVCAVGFGGCKIGYESWNVASTNPLLPTAPVGGRYYADRIPPGRLRGPFDEFTGENFNDCDWLGMRFFENVPDGTIGGGNYSEKDDDLLVEDGLSSRSRTSRKVKWGTYVCYRMSQFDPNENDPRIYREFELMDGDDAPRMHRTRECQNMKGNSIKVLTLRYVSDLALPPSDSEITRVLADELSRGRSQSLVHRNRSMPQNMFDSTQLKQPTVDKIERGDIQGMIGHPGPITDQLIKQINKGDMPQDTYRFNDVIGRDIERSWGLGANQQGQTNDTARTATELSIVENAKDTRLDYERDKIIAWYCNDLVRDIFALMQHYAQQDQSILMTDAQGAQQWLTWNAQAIQGEFAFTIKVNSQLRPDSAAQQKKMLDWVNISAKSPYVNQQENWALLAKEFGFDPARMIKPPPPPQPEQAKLTVSAVDLVTMLPIIQTNPAALQLLAANGVEIPPEMMQLAMQMQAVQEAVAQAAPQNLLTDGTAPKADILSKHNSDETGRLSGGGSMVADMTGSKVMG